MKKDTLLIVIFVGILLLITKSLFKLRLILRIVVSVLILSLFLYKQIKPYNGALFPKHKKWFAYIESFFDTIFKYFRLNPIKLGTSLSIDATALVLLIILLLLLIF
jgi:hypothetical protein